MSALSVGADESESGPVGIQICLAKYQRILIHIFVQAVFLQASFLYTDSLAETVKLTAIGEAWLSDANEEERNTAFRPKPYFKLKTVQEMALLRFDTGEIKGKTIESVLLFLHPVHSKNRLRHIRVSTVNQEWETSSSRWSSQRGASYNFADQETKRAWAWPDSQFCDVSFSSGNSISSWAERRVEKEGWISIAVDPAIITSMTLDDSDGIALMEGGTYKPFNNLVHGIRSKGLSPYLVVHTKENDRPTPDKPIVSVYPSPENADMASGAVKIKIKSDPKAFCWKVEVNGKFLPRWMVPHPVSEVWQEIIVAELPHASDCTIEVVACSPGGERVSSGILKCKVSENSGRRLSLNPLKAPKPGKGEALNRENVKVWALPSLVKICPLNSRPLQPDLEPNPDYKASNSVWINSTVQLSGIRGEYVDFQLCLERLNGPLRDIRIKAQAFKGPQGSVIESKDIEIYKNWYSKTKNDRWQPAYCLPLKKGDVISIPDPLRKLPNQANQTFTVDVYIPKKSLPGVYEGRIKMVFNDECRISIPVRVRVYPAFMPDRLNFWPELNAYRIPEGVHDYYRLAHQHRCVPNFWVFRPGIRWEGKNPRLVWKKYDRLVGPLLSGKAFDKNRRSGVPVECLYLPFKDSWPTPLTRNTYDYQGYWPKKGDSIEHLIQHYLTAPPIDKALSREYKDAFLSVQKQFIAHFKQKGWDKTELQCFFGGKKSHRINYGSNLWWTTDEPYHWEDWMALRFFTGLWARGLRQSGTTERLWPARADISRPQWQGTVLKDRVNVVYFGRFAGERTYRRCREIKAKTGIRVRAYGSAGAHDKSNSRTVALVLTTWLNGGDGFQTWWAKGRDISLDQQEGTPGNALLVPGKRFGIPVVGDIRLKAYRKGEQLVEYLVLLKRKYRLTRGQLKAMVSNVMNLKTGIKPGSSPDDADSLEQDLIKAWQIEGMRKEILTLL